MEAAELLHGARHHLLDVHGTPHIRPQRERRLPSGSDTGGHSLSTCEVQIHDGDSRALLGESQRNRSADTRGRPGYQRDTSVKPAWHGSASFQVLLSHHCPSLSQA